MKKESSKKHYQLSVRYNERLRNQLDQAIAYESSRALDEMGPSRIAEACMRRCLALREHGLQLSDREGWRKLAVIARAMSQDDPGVDEKISALFQECERLLGKELLENIEID